MKYHSDLWKDTLHKVITAHLKKGDSAVRIGAQIDDTALLISKLVGSTGKLFTIEPDTSISADVPIDVDNGEEDEGSEGGEAEDRTILIQTKLENLFPPKINFLQVEAQGNELLVVKQLAPLIESNTDILVLTGFWPYGLMNDGSELLKFFVDRGFHLNILEKGAVEPHEVSMYDLLGAFKPDKNDFCYLLLTRGKL